jgi:TRAP-type mannitol/chloroaromatic compound transport system permease large subunit
MSEIGLWLNLGMLVALCTFILAGIPVAFVLSFCAMLFGGLGVLLGAFDPFLFGALAQRVFGTITSDTLIAIPLFVFMGLMLERSQIAPDLIKTMGRLFGRMNGGLAISVTAVGALLGAAAGVVGATVVTMGLIALPAMIRYRYEPGFATGSICAAGTLGQIIPPATVLVILGEVLANAWQQAQLAQGIFSVTTITVSDLYAGAMIPGLVLTALYAGYQAVLCWWRPAIGPAMPEAEAGNVPMPEVLRVMVAPIVLLIAILGATVVGIATPTEAAAVGAVGATLLAGLRAGGGSPWPIHAAHAAALLLVALGMLADLRLGRANPPLWDQVALGIAGVLTALIFWGVAVSLWRTFRDGVLSASSHATMSVTAMIFATLIGATLFTLVFRGLGGDDVVRGFLEMVPGGKYGALFVVMLVVFLLGFPLDFVEIVIIVVPIAGPVLMQMGIDPIWLGVLIAMNLQTSFLTPPLGPTLFYIQSVLPEGVTSRDVYRGIIPFVVLQVIGLTLVVAFPWMATWLPTVLK